MNQQVTTSDLFTIIGRQTVEIEILKLENDQLKVMLQQTQKSAADAKNGAERLEVVPQVIGKQ